MAELTGTTLRTIRHYHDVGVLAEPARASNGYKSYGAVHLVRVLRIKRLTDLGLSLSQVAALDEADEDLTQSLARLDAELSATVRRLQRVRRELRLILREQVPADLPAEVAQAVAEADADDDLTPTARMIAVVLARVVPAADLKALAGTLREYSRDPAVIEFDALPADADARTRQDLADRLRAAPIIQRQQAMFPQPWGLYSGAPLGPDAALDVVGQAITEFYNPAQIDVLVRMTP
ncbi:MULTISPECIES: helix-turn-helix domain-containing protein [Catenuloplanes]|uniref:DNA-binding transcriptional MerR regulator n=1 Tax=Catenuloplanes niger TaxID=587534 RepID=A0AAE3ZL00_9ACTN|nr:MerR family transcriptional regulator [Catenuloplanes niger]MDR7320555.1 DNA-binding transcriptional MerR regulator [Catenuloplanes niger]